MSKGPLAGLKILDFSTLLPGPYATQMLADMGAHVLRVESPTRPDLARLTPPFVKPGVSSIHASINRNKQCIALNLKKQKSKDIIASFVRDKGYDIVVEGFRPGVLGKLGLGFEDLRRLNPAVIFASITGYGQNGPLAQRAGHDINYLALSGLSSYAGSAASGPPLFSTQVADLAGGSHHAVMGVLSAVVERQAAALRGEVGRGQHIDISMADASFALNCMGSATSLYTGVPQLKGSEVLNGGNPCYDYYKTKDERYLSVGSLEPQFAIAFFETIGKPAWLQRLAGVMIAADGQQVALRADIALVMQTKSLQEWLQVFEGKDCCVEPVLNVLEAAEHPQFAARQMVLEMPTGGGDGDGGTIRQVACPIKFSAHATHRADCMGGEVGKDTLYVLQEELGLSEARIAELKSDGCI